MYSGARHKASQQRMQIVQSSPIVFELIRNRRGAFPPIEMCRQLSILKMRLEKDKSDPDVEVEDAVLLLEGGNGVIAFAAKLPGTIFEVPVQPGQEYMIHRHGFVCATQGVTLSTGFQRSLGAGLFVLGLLGKASPQMPLMLLGPAIKSMLGVLLLGATIGFWPRLFEKHFSESIAYTERLLHLAAR